MSRTGYVFSLNEAITTAPCTIDDAHCSHCGSTDRSNVGRDGYTTCCNERVAISSDDCYGHYTPAARN